MATGVSKWGGNRGGGANAAVLRAEADSLDRVGVTSGSGNVKYAARGELAGGRMYVWFRSGLYVYHAVPLGVFQGLVSAPSAGKYLHAVVFPNYAFDGPL
jgi:hypothetical protein